MRNLRRRFRLQRHTERGREKGEHESSSKVNLLLMGNFRLGTVAASSCQSIIIIKINCIYCEARTARPREKI